MTNMTNTQAEAATEEGVTQGSTPFALNLKNLPDVGHSLVVGPAGAGMSVHLALVASLCGAADKQTLAEVRELRAQHCPQCLTHWCDGRSISQEPPNPSL